MIFGRNDLLQDPPISRVDLLISRNTLTYFGAEAQKRVLANFAFALNPRGFVMVGKAESLRSRTALFEPYDLKRRIFVRNAEVDSGPRLPRPLPRTADAPGSNDGALRTSAFEASLVAQLVVEATGRVSAINTAARAAFGLRAQDVGRPLQDLEISYRPTRCAAISRRRTRSCSPTNEELEAMNDELRDRTDEALQANTFLGSILWSIEQAVVVVDTQLRATAWSNAATELWGLRETEVDGEQFVNLNIRLPVGELRDPLRNAIAGQKQPPVMLEGHNRRGQSIVCEISFAQLHDHLDEGQGVILVMAARLKPDV